MAFPVVVGANDASQPARPNIVFVMADDLGYGDVKCFGGQRCQIDTPGFDRLAREGMRFTDAHANASVCVPTRVAIMTGRYPWRFGAGVRGGPWGFLGPRFPAGTATLGTLLREAGYTTGYVGKWHLGTQMQTVDTQVQGPTNVDYTRPIKVGPVQHGFDESFILPGSLDMYPYAFLRNNQWVGSVTSQKGWSAFNRVGPAADDFEDTKVLSTFCEEAEKFLQQAAAGARKGKPFFLYLALTAPHTPISPSAPFEGKSKLGLYGDFVMETDHCVSRILAALRANGVQQNTLVIVTSDHGPAAYAGRLRQATYLQLKELQKEGHFSGGPYRGYKFSVYEGGLRVPLVARWPGIVPAGSTCNRLIGIHDLMATVAEVSGGKLASSDAPDSVSFLPLLKDPNAAPTRASMILESTGAMVVRSGPWKLALCPGSGTGGRWGNLPRSEDAWKQALRTVAETPQSHQDLLQPAFVQLFNLTDDPGEQHNLAGQHWEKVTELVAILRDAIERGRTTPGQSLPHGRKEIKLFKSVPPWVWKAGV
ncbi:MAG: arylsulfatase [Pirellulales bacterium]|nr:arylsulfatase [Pirellulales bacterium]